MGTRSLTVFVQTEWNTSALTGRKRQLVALPEPVLDVEEIVVMYRQYDGYPAGHGQQLADFLLGGQLVNGYSPGQTIRVFNGMNDLAGQAITFFKAGDGQQALENSFNCGRISRDLDKIRLIDETLANMIADLIADHKALAGSPRLVLGPGNIYIHPAGTRDAGEEWLYTVYNDPGPKPTLKDENGQWITVTPKAAIRLRVQGGDVTYFGLPGTKQKNMPVYFDGLPSEFDAKTIDSDYKNDRRLGNIPNDYLNPTTKRRAS